jgi:hypothetical protein
MRIMSGGDGALERARIAGSLGPPETIHDKAVSRLACHRAPWSLGTFATLGTYSGEKGLNPISIFKLTLRSERV